MDGIKGLADGIKGLADGIKGLADGTKGLAGGIKGLEEPTILPKTLSPEAASSLVRPSAISGLIAI